MINSSLNSPNKYFLFLFGVIIAGIIGCATPIAPTGGPSDKTGPEVEYTIPETGATNFNGRTFTFQFDEFVNRASVASAITVEPDLGIEYDLDWRRKQLIIEFEEDFPDSTTVILTLGTDLSDTRGNKIGSPIRLAISTGNEIDKGEISGRIRLASDGKGAGDQKVLLYRQPFDFTKRASYEAQTDTGGVFEFSYLADGRYKALYVDDRNRNKIWDRGSESAYPFFREFITLAKEGKDTLDVIYTSQVDSIAPNLQGVGLFSTNRMRLRFSENVVINEETELTILDSLGNTYTTAYPLYVSPKEQFVAFAQSEEPMLANKDYTLKISGIADGAGNVVDTSGYAFTGTAQEDTTLQRHISANGNNGILQNEVFKVTFAAPITDTDIIDSTVVIEGQVDFDDWPEIEAVRNKLLIKPQGEWIAGVEYQFLVWNPVTQRRKLYEPEVWDSTEYGEIEVTLENIDSTDVHYLRIINPDGEVQSVTQFNQSVIISDLPPLSYTLILFRDENGDGKWNRGTVIPYTSPEQYYVQQGLRVQEGFTSGVNINFD
jgi:hypothetical protein